jgi:hypothetical protein
LKGLLNLDKKEYTHNPSFAGLIFLLFMIWVMMPQKENANEPINTCKNKERDFQEVPKQQPKTIPM